MNVVKEMQEKVCKLDYVLEDIDTDYADGKLTVNEYRIKMRFYLDKQRKLNDTISALRLEQWKKELAK